MNILKIDNENYPELLKQIHNPPRKIFYKGDIKCLEKPCVSFVGTRKNSGYGEFATKKLIEELAILDIVIVSGLAKGIDTISHKTALENSLPTIAVLGSGIENIYPKENEKLAKDIENHGLIISEYEGFSDPTKLNFPMRNRIISGLSIATVVIEAPENSGALITARFALEQGRDIFVVPGDIDRENSKGILNLLQKGGAYPVSSGEEIIEILKMQPHLIKERTNTRKKPITYEKINKQKIKINYNLSSEEEKVFERIQAHRGIYLDDIKEKTGISAQNLLSAISILEINGLVEARNGKYFKKC